MENSRTPAPPPQPTQPPFTVVGPPVQHTDRCVRDAARYGFCEHTMLGRSRPRPQGTQGTQGPHGSVQSFRHQHPVTRELVGSLALGLLGYCFYLLWTQFGWLSLLVFNGICLGWLLLMVTGLPRWLTVDMAHLISPRRTHPDE